MNPLKCLVVAAALTAVLTVVVAAGGVGARGEVAREESLDDLVGVAAVAGIGLDAHPSEGHDGASADSSADELGDAEVLEVDCEGLMPCAAVVDDAGGDDLVILDLVELELLCVSEMLEDFAVPVCGSDYHQGARMPFG